MKTAPGKNLSEKGFTLVELMIALSIFAVTFTLASYGVIRFKQSLEVTNAAKEMITNLRKARRFALDGVVTEDGTASSYYIEINPADNNYNWFECSESGNCSDKGEMKSPYYTQVEVSKCKDGSSEYEIIEFEAVTGRFVVKDSSNNVLTNDYCDIELKTTSSMVSTTRKVRVNVTERTIKFAT